MTFKTLIAAAAVVFVPGFVQAEIGPLERVQTIGYELDEIEELAGRLERQARRVRRAAERVADPLRDQEAQTLELLLALEERAGSFHDDVGRFGGGFSNAEGDFGEVQRAYIRLSRAISDMGGWSKVRNEFGRLSDAMFELEMYTVDLLTRIHLADERGAGHTALVRQGETRGGQQRRRTEIAQASEFAGWDWESWDCLDVALR